MKMYKNTFQTKSSKKRSVKEVITKNPGKSTWSDRDKGVLSDRGYKVVKPEKNWKGLSSIVMEKKTLKKEGNTRIENRYFISSLKETLNRSAVQ